MRSRTREFFGGVRLLFRGFRAWSSDPRSMALGAIPAFIAAAAMIAVIVLVSLNVEAWAAALTPWADTWDVTWAVALRFGVALGIAIGTIVICVLSFAAITLTIGEPFYEKIRARVEQRLGNPPSPPSVPFLRGLAASARDGVILVLLALGTGLVVFLAGLVPVVGTVLGLTLGATLGGRTLARELTGFAGDARGMSLASRRALLRTRPWRAFGFGVAAYFTLLVPFVAIIAMPAAVVGATLLVRELRGEPTVNDGPMPHALPTRHTDEARRSRKGP